MLRNYLNYAGSKDRYYPLIQEQLKRAIGRKKRGKYLVDMFCGSAVVAFNSRDMFEHVIAFDKVKELIGIHTSILYTPTEELLKDIHGIIDSYGLSKTNKEGFLKLREFYNSCKIGEQEVAGNLSAYLYCLITHSFNYSLHLNKKGEFNAPAGTNRSYFSPALEKKLIAYKNFMDERVGKTSHILYATMDLLQDDSFLNEDEFKDVVFFIDPPYSASISKHPYRIGNLKWTEDDDRRLFEYMNKINELGSKFVFTNVFENNGIQNLPLQEWSKGYHVQHVNVDYTNCNYQRLNKGNTDEVIITNF